VPGAAHTAYTSCLALFAVVTAKTAVENQYFYRTTNLALGVRGALSTAVYRKSLRLSPGARQVTLLFNHLQFVSAVTAVCEACYACVCIAAVIAYMTVCLCFMRCKLAYRIYRISFNSLYSATVMQLS
jgi:hypothetical protein